MNRQRSYSWDDPASLAAKAKEMDGLGFLRAFAAGDLVHPPICATIGFRITEVDEGRCVIELEPGEHQYNPIGMVHGGVVVAAIDTAASNAVHSTLGPGVGYSTVDISTNFLRPLTVDAGPVRCEGTVINRGRRIALAEARLTDGAGRLYAHGTTTCLILS